MTSSARFIRYLLPLSSLLYITTCTVYTVTPDDDDDHYYTNTTCHHCHNLQHYMLNVTKYFTSNTQLLFLPGLHHLHTDLIIQNVHNISLIGSTNGTRKITNIYCNSMFIVMINVSKLTIKNILIAATHSQHPISQRAPLTMKDYAFIVLYSLEIYQSATSWTKYKYRFSLTGINIMGNSSFTHIKFSNILL